MRPWRLPTVTGLRLPRIFRGAGLGFPQMIQMARVVSGPDSPGYVYTEQVTRTILPLMLQTGVATAAEVDVDTLADRVRDDVVASEAALVPPPLVAAWARKGPETGRFGDGHGD